jgi:hypothetical protein
MDIFFQKKAKKVSTALKAVVKLLCFVLARALAIAKL